MISIALASYNGTKYLREQLDSILSQTYQDFELIICDDCSTDNTWQILEEYAQKDSRIKIFANKKNQGFKKNFEKAISLCKGEYIAMSDQDDIWTENHLEVLLENIGDNDLVCGNAWLADENGNSTKTSLLGCSKFDYLPSKQEDWFFFLLHGNIFQGTACLFSKRIVKQAFPIPAKVKYHDYWIAMMSVLNCGVKYVDIPILFYRQHGDNVTTNVKWSIINRIKIIKIYKDYNRLQINILQSIVPYCSDIHNQDLIENAIKYFTRFNSIQMIKNIPYFIKNYKRIYLSKTVKVFTMRFIKKFLLFQ
jgi:glycosyltransferase involved in cell wall biosynthesis